MQDIRRTCEDGMEIAWTARLLPSDPCRHGWLRTVRAGDGRIAPASEESRAWPSVSAVTAVTAAITELVTRMVPARDLAGSRDEVVPAHSHRKAPVAPTACQAPETTARTRASAGLIASHSAIRIRGAATS